MLEAPVVVVVAEEVSVEVADPWVEAARWR